MKRKLCVGSKVAVCHGSGVDSGKTGIIMSRNDFSKEVGTDGRCIPKLAGHYKPVDWKKESAIRLEGGMIITMYDNRLIPQL